MARYVHVCGTCREADECAVLYARVFLGRHVLKPLLWPVIVASKVVQHRECYGLIVA